MLNLTFQGRESPVVQNQEVCTSQLTQQLQKASVTPSEGKLVGEARNSVIADTEPLTAGSGRESASKPGLSNSGGASQDNVSPVAYPMTGGQVLYYFPESFPLWSRTAVSAFLSVRWG